MTFEVDNLRQGYEKKLFTPADIINEVYRRIDAQGERFIWVSLVKREDALINAHVLMKQDLSVLPLFGIPFSVKDNIHVSGLKTTASCPAFAHYPEYTATVVEKLIEAGAILVGKNTMDQFATGLVGIRSPGHPVNPFNSEYIPGGSSSGSAVAVSTGLVSFSLGSDTGGSGRIPAALNNIVGLKPTPGLISTHGMVYANRSFDCVPIFSLTCQDAKTVFDVAIGYDVKDPFSTKDIHLSKASLFDKKNFTVGIPDSDSLLFYGDSMAEECFDQAKEMVSKLGGKIVEIDFSLFIEAGKMIFDGPFLAERLASLEDFFKSNRQDVNAVVASIVEKAGRYSAVDLCREYYRLKDIQCKVDDIFKAIDVLMVPTAGTIYKIKDVESNPVGLNANMGYYTYYANILKLSALAVPAAIRGDGLPFGVCFLSESQKDDVLVDLGLKWERLTSLPLGASLKG